MRWAGRWLQPYAGSFALCHSRTHFQSSICAVLVQNIGQARRSVPCPTAGRPLGQLSPSASRGTAWHRCYSRPLRPFNARAFSDQQKLRGRSNPAWAPVLARNRPDPRLPVLGTAGFQPPNRPNSLEGVSTSCKSGPSASGWVCSHFPGRTLDRAGECDCLLCTPLIQLVQMDQQAGLLSCNAVCAWICPFEARHPASAMNETAPGCCPCISCCKPVRTPPLQAQQTARRHGSHWQ